MLNDVKIPPLEPRGEPPGKTVRENNRARKISETPVPPAQGRLKADVTLFDEDTTQPRGAGNFSTLSIFIVVVLLVVATFAWLAWL